MPSGQHGLGDELQWGDVNLLYRRLFADSTFAGRSFFAAPGMARPFLNPLTEALVGLLVAANPL